MVNEELIYKVCQRHADLSYYQFIHYPNKLILPLCASLPLVVTDISYIVGDTIEDLTYSSEDISFTKRRK